MPNYSGMWTLSQAQDAIAAGNWQYPTAGLYAWGYNGQGTLGTNNLTYYSSPKQVSAGSEWVSISGLALGSFGIKTDGTLWSWGQNYQGALGLGDTTNRSSPTQVGSLTNWSKVSTGSGRTALAIKTDGTLWAWGNSRYGELGNGSYGMGTGVSSPIQIGSETNWLSVASGSYISFAIKTTGSLWAWGRNNRGQLGLSNTIDYSSPKQVGSLTNWLKVASSRYASAAIKTDGTLWTWGFNSQGQLGNNTVISSSSPAQVGALTNWLDIASGYGNFCVAVRTDGTLWSWGYNPYGNLGLNNTTYAFSSPQQVGSLTNWLSISCGTYYAISKKTDGTLWGWGNNQYGQLGLGNTTNYSSPKQVGSNTKWTNITIGGYATLAIST